MLRYLSIGDFSRATHMTVKTLRHYHGIGLLKPAAVDQDTGYRRYSTEQIPIAQVIRRLRDLDMPLEEIQAVLTAPDLETRNERISAHLSRLEEDLSRTQQAVTALRDLLAPHTAEIPGGIELRSVEAVHAAAITEIVDAEDSGPWLRGALGELHATLTAQNLDPAGHSGGIYADDVFTHYQGQVTIFVPCTDPIRPLGRVTSLVIPAAELAVITHSGSPSDIDRAYGTLATYVTRHALAVDGPIREYYVVGQHDTADTSQWRTEIGWPVFQTGAGTRPATA
ncbi:MerR family transcriptional regulator [Nonomuraea sp. M3C6]|uniref:MerR family transcriptional regulator n=1 Tax=Nonomuraea marmarensis TaxID=3351344 RepID=A0ABW7AXG3_9ACTN